MKGKTFFRKKISFALFGPLFDKQKSFKKEMPAKSVQ
jgi:hypothetical protein